MLPPKGSTLRTALFGFCLVSLTVAFAASAAAANPRTSRSVATQNLPASKFRVSSKTLSLETSMSASISIPLTNNCLRSQAQGGSLLTSGLGSDQAATITVGQVEGATLSGTLRDARGGGVADALICIYSNVVTDEES